MLSYSVRAPSKTYPVFIGTHIIKKEMFLSHKLVGNQVFIVTNSTIAKWYLEPLIQALPSHIQIDTHLVPDGESFKNLQTLETIFDALIEKRHERSTTLIALGGGVIGDMTGFAAACYLRGVSFIQIPTTLLAQVDAAIGGKTAVNHLLGKNLIGAFYQPEAVICDIHTLKTLNDRQYLAGLFEVIKYGLIYDVTFFKWLEQHLSALLQRDEIALIHAVSESVRIKALFVSEDEKEAGIRALLNFGHTFGHAIETLTHYQMFLHGEAVGIGMLLAAQMSYNLGYLKKSEISAIENLICQIGLPHLPKNTLSSQQVLEAMFHDKKVLNAKINLVLLDKIGKAFISHDFDQDALIKVLVEYFD